MAIFLSASLNVWLPWWLSGKKKNKNKNNLPMQEIWVQSLGQEEPLEKEMATLPGRSYGQRNHRVTKELDET